MNIEKINLLDAQAMHRLYPSTFDVPSDAELDTIKIGDIVKICDGSERFWVIIILIEDGKLVGAINNVLVGDKPYKFGDLIEFEKKNVYSFISA
jgi:hypothetical protein